METLMGFGIYAVSAVLAFVLARKIGVILHRMWVDGTDFRWTKAELGSGVAAH